MSATGEAAAAPARGTAVCVLAATIIGSSVVFIDGTIVNIALPVLQRDLGANVVELQWVAEAFLLLLTALLLTGGMLGDRFGRKRLFAIGMVAFAAEGRTEQVARAMTGAGSERLPVRVARRGVRVSREDG